MKSLFKLKFTYFYLSFFTFFPKIDGLFQNFIHQKTIRKSIQEDTKHVILAKQKLVNDEYLNQLNETELYLIVTSQKKKKNKLLLIQTQERLSGSFFLHHIRFAHIWFKGRQKKFFPRNWFNRKTYEVYRGVRIKRMFRPEMYSDSPLAEYYRSGKIYFPQNLGGYKSIAPVFFDQQAAEEFLLHATEIGLDVVQMLPLMIRRNPKKIFLTKIVNTKIIKIGLGDFLTFYSDSSNAQALNKTEFLFFPSYEELNKRLVDINLPFFQRPLLFETFNSYQKKLLAQKIKL